MKSQCLIKIKHNSLITRIVYVQSYVAMWFYTCCFSLNLLILSLHKLYSDIYLNYRRGDKYLQQWHSNRANIQFLQTYCSYRNRYKNSCKASNKNLWYIKQTRPYCRMGTNQSSSVGGRDRYRQGSGEDGPIIGIQPAEFLGYSEDVPQRGPKVSHKNMFINFIYNHTKTI